VIFRPLALADAYLVVPERREDERGWFARTWCEREASALGLNARVVQCNVSFNRHRGTLRGLHYQAAPCAEAKLVRCTRGAIHDVIVDLRLASRSYLQHIAVVLTADNRHALYVPEGFAHGFQTLADDTEVVYQMSEFYAPEHARGIRWNDPAFGIRWPQDDPILSARDRAYPDWTAGAVRAG
jgi:dTDP-4-dehydrorhamnose 3,5-epimerase